MPIIDVSTFFFRLTLVHKFHIDTSNVAKIYLKTRFVEKRGFNANKCGVRVHGVAHVKTVSLYFKSTINHIHIIQLHLKLSYTCKKKTSYLSNISVFI